jgi:hypothetical protein
LLIYIANFASIDFFIFGADIVCIIFLYNHFFKSNSLNEDMKAPILKNIVAWINTIILLVVLLIINFLQTPPDYINNDLNQTIHIASNQVYSNCLSIDYILRISNEITAMKWWAMLNFTTFSTENYYIKEIAWLLFLLGNYLAIFSFSRYIVEIIHFIKEKTDESKIQTK